eukprot:TRINITY_DN10846_c0_g1_i1.p1 TRINITY_DN10846_c0_g1~~TRINITY_DN10846_c0_g1_i1.p1  ORF type:complete len:709 (+),score=223.20 TRINITY_DN10846_c0_g1_i1:90-2129(+)
MSIEGAKVANPDEGEAAMKDVEDVNSSTTWALFGYSDGSDQVRYLSKGEGGPEDVRKHFTEDQTVFAVLAVANDEGGLNAVKRVFVSWVGPKVKPLSKARSTQHRRPVYEFANRVSTLAGEMQVSEAEEFSQKLIWEKLSGSRHAEVGTDTTSSVQAGQAQSSGGTALVDFGFVDEAAAKVALEDLQDRKTDTNWVAFGYEDGAKDNIILFGKGSGGRDEVEAAHFHDDKNVYTFLAVPEPNDYAAAKKHLFVAWVGEQVKGLHRARSSQHRWELYKWGKALIQLHGELQALTRSDVTNDMVLEKLFGIKSSMSEQDRLRAAGEADEARKTKKANAVIATTGNRFDSSSGHAVGQYLADEADATAAIKAIGDSSDSTNWVLFGYTVERPASISVLDKGQGGLDEFRDRLTAEGVFYVLLGHGIAAEGDYTSIKIVLIHWVGSKVKPLKKARSSQHRVALYNFANKLTQLAGEYQAVEDENLTAESITAKLTGSNVRSEEENKQAGADVHKMVQTRTAKAGGGSRLRKGGGSSFKVEDEPGVEAALNELRDNADEETFNWLLFTPGTGATQNTFSLEGRGAGMDALRPKLPEDQIRFAIFAQSIKDEDEAGYCSTWKFVFICWVGPRVKPLAKARASQHRVALYKHCSRIAQMHGEIQALELDDVTAGAVLEKVTGSRVH